MCPLELPDRLAGGGQQIVSGGEVVLDEVDGGLRVGLRAEGGALGLKLIFERTVVLHNPIVHDDDFARGADMGMGISGVWFSVGRPARVPDANEAVHTRWAPHG